MAISIVHVARVLKRIRSINSWRCPGLNPGRPPGRQVLYPSRFAPHANSNSIKTVFSWASGSSRLSFWLELLLQDDDTSYLDEATRAPDAPHREPGADSVATDKDGVLVDEFGLPKIPAQWVSTFLASNHPPFVAMTNFSLVFLIHFNFRRIP